MTTDLGADLRREFDEATPPSSLTFHPGSVLRQGNRTIRRHRIIAAGAAAMAVAVVATGATLLGRPHDSTMPVPADQTPTTGVVTAGVGFSYGTPQVELNRDARVESNIKYSVVTPDGRRHELGGSSTGKPGQRPDVTWGSGVVSGHPVTIGLVPTPAQYVAVTFANGASYAVEFEELKGTGYTMFAVDFTKSDAIHRQPTRPVEIASIRWTGATGIIDGIEGDHRLSGRALHLSKDLLVEVVLRPGAGGRRTVFGCTYTQHGSGSFGANLSVLSIDPDGAAVVTGRQPIVRTTAQGVSATNDGPPIAAGILPPGASDIGVILTRGVAADVLVTPERMPDGTVIFAVRAQSALRSQPIKDSIKAVTWTNSDGTKGQMKVTQKQS